MIFIEQDIITKEDKSDFKGQDTRTKMRVGCIKMQLVSIKMMVHLCVGIFTVVTSFFVMRSKQVSM
jgi:hypothetical protein